MSITTQDKSIHTWSTVQMLSARSRLQLLRRHDNDYTWLDAEYANIQVTLSWLTGQNGMGEAQLLLDYLRLLAPYFQQRSLLTELLQWCAAGIRAAETLGQSPAWLLLLCGQSRYALAEWQEARNQFQAAIKASEQQDRQTYARALLALGRLEFNQGNYQRAFATMDVAKQEFLKLNDQEHLLIILGEKAAYYLNRNEFDKALSLYLEIDRMQKEHGATESSDHTLLMLGVVYRRKQDYARAERYLQQLFERGESQKNHAAMATAAHHLAWSYLSENKLAQARAFCGRAIRLYEEIGDERGFVGTYEQLGCIALSDGQEQEALRHLHYSLARKRQRQSQMGEASVLRHLAVVYLSMGNFREGGRYLWQSLALYRRLGMLTRRRLTNILQECLTWTLGKQRWVK